MSTIITLKTGVIALLGDNSITQWKIKDLVKTIDLKIQYNESPIKPIQIQIGQLIAKSPDKQKEKRRLIRRTKEETEEAQIAIAREGSIYIEPVTKNILSDI